MPNPLKILRSSVAGLRPTGKTPGELYVNFADGVVGYIDEAGQPVDIDTSGGGPAYVLPPATPTVLGGVMPDGTTITVAADGAITSPDQDLSGYLPLTGGTLTGALEGTDVTLSGHLEGTTGAFTGGQSLTINHDGIDGTGVVLEGPSGSARGFRSKTGGVMRWIMTLGDATAETGGSSGSDILIQGHNDAGNASPFTPLRIVRATGQSIFSMPISEASDISTKSNVTPVEAALDIVNRLTGVFYNQYDNPKRQVGLIAQDTQEVLPEVVFQAPPKTNEQGETTEGLLGVAYGSLVAVLVEAVKELSAKVTALEGGAPAERNVTVNTVKVQPKARPRR